MAFSQAEVLKAGLEVVTVILALVGLVSLLWGIVLVYVCYFVEHRPMKEWHPRARKRGRV